MTHFIVFFRSIALILGVAIGGLPYKDPSDAPLGFSVGFCGGEDGSAYYGSYISLINSSTNGGQLKFASTDNKIVCRRKNNTTGEWLSWYEL